MKFVVSAFISATVVIAYTLLILFATQSRAFIPLTFEPWFVVKVGAVLGMLHGVLFAALAIRWKIVSRPMFVATSVLAAASLCFTGLFVLWIFDFNWSVAFDGNFGYIQSQIQTLLSNAINMLFLFGILLLVPAIISGWLAGFYLKRLARIS